MNLSNVCIGDNRSFADRTAIMWRVGILVTRPYKVTENMVSPLNCLIA